MDEQKLKLTPTGIYGLDRSLVKVEKLVFKKFCGLVLGITGALSTGWYFSQRARENQRLLAGPTDFSPPVSTTENTEEKKVEAPSFPEYSPIHAEAERMARDMVARNGRAGYRKFMGPHLIARSKTTEIPLGSLAEATLISGASNGPVKAALSEDLIVNGELILPSGSILLGSGSSTEERLYIRFSKLVNREGKAEPIQAEAADFGDKIAGLKGSKVGQYAMRLGAGIGLNFVAGMSEVLQDQKSVGPMGMPVKDPSMKNAFLNGAEKASMEEAQDIMSGLKDKQPIIEVKAGTKILVLFGESS